jgi:hypothetical protein
MINYRVDDLDALLAALKEEGVEIDPKREDPEGNRIELWAPPNEGVAGVRNPADDVYYTS